MNVWWSVGLTLLGGLGWLLVTVEKHIQGFVIGLLAQVVWVTYAIVTAQWGFLGSAALFGAINALGVYRWARNRREAATEPLRAEKRHRSDGGRQSRREGRQIRNRSGYSEQRLSGMRPRAGQ